MISPRAIQHEDTALWNWSAAVDEAALAFERRWTLAALNRVDADVYTRLRGQRALFDEAMLTGRVDEIELHGAAMVRGYRKAVEVMQQAAAPDDAYRIGQDPRSGLRVAIGEKAAAGRVRELYGDMCCITPDEVAAILANLAAFKPIAAIKRLFPGAEVIDVRPGGRQRSTGGSSC
jgi:hypothetical protein